MREVGVPEQAEAVDRLLLTEIDVHGHAGPDGAGPGGHRDIWYCFDSDGS